MALIETIVGLAGPGLVTGSGLGSGFKDLVEFLRSQVKLESVLADLVEDEFKRHLPRVRHLSLASTPTFDRAQFVALLAAGDFTVSDPEDLVGALLPAVRGSFAIEGTLRSEAELDSVYASILNAALRGMWKKIGTYPALANELVLGQAGRLEAATKVTSGHVEQIDQRLAALTKQVEELAVFAKTAWTQVYDKLSDTAPPTVHQIDQQTYLNPFLLARAEDFNHNYENLARLFQGSPDWDSIQRPSDNVVIEGGRGTGKSMLLRRLTAQAALTDARIRSNPSIGFVEANIPYFGVYVKLTRGYYDQLASSEAVPPQVSGLLAQHELNIEVFDAFVDTARWVIRERGLTGADDKDAVVRALTMLFPKAPTARSLAELQDVVVQFEQDQVAEYFRERAFGRAGDYRGSAVDSVTFLRKLSQLFRAHLFPNQSVRLFILIDEFETLLEVQQEAVNTVIKMRLPDLTCKIAVRPAGRKTANTFTPSDPIQDPRDFTKVTLEYDINEPAYRELLLGIAEKRLTHAGYPIALIDRYLVGLPSDEVTEEELGTSLEKMWRTGNRRSDGINDEFREKYRLAAVYRALRAMHRRKSYAGFDQFVMLSSGIVSNFIELCKYAFYFALSDKLLLKEAPAIPPYLQTEAAYRVSLRLLGTVGSNVPLVGIVLEQLLIDLGTILRSRLLNHPSEPEANRLAIGDYSNLSAPSNTELAKVLDGAVVWSVLHLEGGASVFSPRNRTRPPSAELMINRIYCPALGISPRARWRVALSTTDLRRLIEPAERSVAFAQLMRTLGHSGDSAQPTLFSGSAEVTE